MPLLEQLAWALYYDDQEEEALRRIREARALEPAKSSLFDVELTILKFLDRYFEAFDVSDRYASSSAQSPEARASRGDLLDDLGFYALSWDTFGPADGLSAWARNLRRKQWWRTGGPWGVLRRRIRATDRSTLDSWKERAEDLGHTLRPIVGPDRLAELRTVADHSLFYEMRWRLRWGRANVVARLAAGYAGSIAGGFVLARMASDLGPLWSSAVGVGGAAIIFGALRGVYGFTRAEPGDRILTRVLPAGLAVVVAGYAIARFGGRWPVLVGATMMAIAAVAALRLLVASVARVGEALKVRRIQRADPRGFALLSLLEMLPELGRPALRNELGWRRHRLQTLEQVAIRLETDLPAVFPRDPANADVLRHRGRRAAAAVRELKYLLVAAPPGAWRRIETVLRTDIAALATGSLGRLHATDPPAPETHRRSRRQIVADARGCCSSPGCPSPWSSRLSRGCGSTRRFSTGRACSRSAGRCSTCYSRSTPRSATSCGPGSR